MRGENWRFWVLIGVLVLFAGYCAQKLIRSHLDPEAAAPNYYFTRELIARRGSIYSANGKDYPFVRSVPFWEYRLDPQDLTNTVNSLQWKRRARGQRTEEEVLKTIASALNLEYGKLQSMMTETKSGFRNQFLAMSPNPEVHRILSDSKQMAGVAIHDRQVRQYLHGRRLSHVLGSINAEYVGSSGLEQKYDSQLKGTPGIVRGMKDAHGRELYDKRIISVSATPGVDLYLTIDQNIQFEVEDALKDGIREYGAGSGWSIVMNARTGAILAMASFPDFDPLAFGHTGDNAKLNRAIAFTYEPGSVMKVITAAAAIDAKRATPETIYRTNRDDPRYYRLPNDAGHDWVAVPRPMTIREAIVHSSNIVIGKLGYDLGPKLLWTYMRRFGFGARTGIELPGEECGILRDWQKWDKATQSRAAIGQGVSVTAIQLASAYQAIANDGVRMQPYIVDHIIDADGTESYHHTPEAIGRPVSAATARTMRKVMLDVASSRGTARRAAVRGYSVAGKTGTAQKVIGRSYAAGLFRASFCGIVPASDPELVILVSLDFDQRTLYHQGGNSSGPIFRRIAKAALSYLMITPDKPEELEESEDDELERIVDERSKKYDIIPRK